MLFLLIKYGLLFFLSFVYGVAVIKLFSKKENGSLPFFFYPVTGLAVLATLANILSLFLPIGFFVKISLLVLGIVLFTVNYQHIKQVASIAKRGFDLLGLPAKLVLFFAVAFVLYITAQPTLSYDEGLYYIQFIKWTETYPAVPGLANLHHRFGFNSSWHLLSALFNTSSFTGVEENRINGIIYLFVLAHFLTGLQEENAFLRWLNGGMLLAASLPFFIVYYLTSPNADIVILFLFLFCLNVFVTGIIKGVNDKLQYFLVAILCIYMLTIKPSAIPVLCLPAIIFFRWVNQKQYNTIASFLLFSFIIITPWVIRNIILTGFILFPFEKLDLFSFDWKVPAANAVEAKRMIKESAYYLYNDNSVLQAGSYAEKIKIWFLRNLRIYDKLFLIGAACSPVVLFLYRRQVKKEIAWVWIGLLAGMLFWFIQAPDPRFGYAYILPAFLLAIATVAANKIPAPKILFVSSIFILLAGTTLLYRYLNKKFIREERIKATANNNWLLPSPYFVPVLHQNDTLPFVQKPVVGDQCWDAPLPCSAEQMGRFEKRGSGLKEGFRPARRINQ